MAFPKNNLNKFSAQNLLVSRAIHSRRDFLKLSTSAGALTASATIPAAVASLIAPQRLEAAESSRSINWKEILQQFGDLVLIPGEVDRSEKDMIVGRTMNEIYQHYSWQQRKWCSEDASHCEGEVAHARRDNRVLVSWDYIISVPILGRGQSATSMRAREFSSIYLPLGIYNKHEHIAREFANYANDILGLSGKYSDLQMVEENGDSRPLLLSKQGVPVFFSAEELLFIYAHYRMNKVTAEEIQFAGTVLDYGGVNSAAQARALRYKRIGNVRAAGMNNLQIALHWMFVHHRFINEKNDQSVDSTAPSENYDPMTEYWNEDGYWKGGRKISAEQTQARIRAMLAKDPKPLGEIGKRSLKWWSSAEFVPPTLTDIRGKKISAENPIDFVNVYADRYFANDPERDLKAMMLLSNLQIKDQFDFHVRELYGGEGKRLALQTTKTLKESKVARLFQGETGTPRSFLTEESPATTIAQN